MKKYNLKTIVGFPNYQISNDGKVWSKPRYGVRGGWLKQRRNPREYLSVVLYKNTKTKPFLIHRLVAQAYVPNPKNKPYVNHLNGIKNDNHAENLEWVTPKENSNHAWEIGLFDNRDQKGENSGKAKLTWEQVNEMRENHIPRNGIYKRKPWNRYGISSANYYKILNNKLWYNSEYKKEINK